MWYVLKQGVLWQSLLLFVLFKFCLFTQAVKLPQPVNLFDSCDV